MTHAAYSLADHEGTLCVIFHTSDWTEPLIYTHYWPTVASTADFKKLDPQTPLDAWKVIQCTPGEYRAIHPQGTLYGSVYLSLTHGGKTEPVKTETRPAKVPRTGKNTRLEWINGQWHKCTAAGKWETIAPTF